jgi:hypothetical protein
MISSATRFADDKPWTFACQHRLHIAVKWLDRVCSFVVASLE